MAIQSNDNYGEKRSVYFPIYLVLFIGILSGLARGETLDLSIQETPQQEEIAQASQESSGISCMRQKLAVCKDTSLASGLTYKIGTMCFNEGKLPEAQKEFSQLQNDTQCPKAIQFLSLNMLGQIYRLTARNDDALKAFKDMQSLFISAKGSLGDELSDRESKKIVCFGMFGRAEIYEALQDYKSSIAEYENMIRFFKKWANNGSLKKYEPLAEDRISQLFLREGQIEKYLEHADVVLKNYPDYSRVPLFKLEVVCVKFAKTNNLKLNYSLGVSCVPVQVIGKVRSLPDKSKVKPLADEFDRICLESAKSPLGILMNYHYAWLLDAAGQTDRAGQVFNGIYANAQKTGVNKAEAILGDIPEYARIQHAIILCEKAKYSTAQNVLDEVSSNSSNPHIAKLKESVKDSVRILEREVGAYESK